MIWLDSGTHAKVEGKKKLHKVILWPLYVHSGQSTLIHTRAHTHTYTHTHRHIQAHIHRLITDNDITKKQDKTTPRIKARNRARH